MLDIVAISLTDRCNLHCSHCGSGGIRSGNGPKRPELERTALRRVFVQLRALGVTSVVLSGGEPLLRQDFFSIVGDLKEAGLMCGLLTNGTLLTPQTLRRLKETGTIEFIRLSVEFPGELPQSGPVQGRFHDATRTFSTIERIADSSMKAGVNMTLLPGNLQYAVKLAGKSRKAGASFFRAVPLLPVGRSAMEHLPTGFFPRCIAAALSLHAEFTKKIPGDRLISRKRFIDGGDNFITACSGGSRALSISTDGRAHICAMTDLGGREVYITERSVRECIEILTRRRKYLQNKITGSPESDCLHCRIVALCRGGCLAEWAARDRKGGQPCCLRKNWRKAAAMVCTDKRVMETAAEMFDKDEVSRLFNRSVPCLRALPFWTVEF
jgi:radical SAM protein with 4Fe4S-binding SPASM domain